MRLDRLFASLLLLALAAYPMRGGSQDAPASYLGDEDPDPYAEAVARYARREAPKIIGGPLAAEGAYPWQVSLGVASVPDPYWAHYCGGTIYSATWIITAAHCVKTLPEGVTVIAGTNKLTPGIPRRSVKRIIVKRDFNPQTKDNDIALLELAEPLVLGGPIQAVPLMTADNESTALVKGASLKVLGWGATVRSGDAVQELRELEVPFVERTVCNRALAYDGRITTNMICAGYTVGGKDSCQGDSGGPLIAATGASPKLAGIVSAGDGCAMPNRVGVYTRVANYVAWISECTADVSKCQ